MSYRGRIQWNPIEAPDFSASIRAMEASGESFDQALKNLQGIADDRQELADKNYANQQNKALSATMQNLGALEQAALAERIKAGFGDSGLSGENQAKVMNWATNRHNTLSDTAAEQKFELDQYDKETQRWIAQEQTRQGFEKFKLEEQYLNNVDEWKRNQYATYMSGTTGLVDKDGNPVKRTPEEGTAFLASLDNILGSREFGAPPPITIGGQIQPEPDTKADTALITGTTFGSNVPASTPTTPPKRTIADVSNEHKVVGDVWANEVARVNSITPAQTEQGERALTGTTEPTVPDTQADTARIFGSLPQVDSTKAVTAPASEIERTQGIRAQSRQGDTTAIGTQTGDVAVAPTQFESTGNTGVDNLFTATGLVPESKKNMNVENRKKSDERIQKANDAADIYTKQVNDLQQILARPEGIKAVTGFLGSQASNTTPEWYEQPWVTMLQGTEAAADTVTKLVGDEETAARIDQKATERGEVRALKGEFSGGSFVALGKEVGTTDVSNADAKDYKVSVADLDAASSTPQAFTNAVTKTLLLLEYRKRKGLAEANLKPNQYLNDEQMNVLMRQVESDLGLVRDGNNWTIRPTDQRSDVNAANQTSLQQILSANPNTATPNSPSEAQAMYDRDAAMLLADPSAENIKYFVDYYGAEQLPPELRR
ncbi:TPA: hypothetical protein P0E36_005232 [Vibrio harveyi]|nr:hypothetical protein [Vibrio harveyi]